MADAQRMELKRLEDQARDKYAADIRAMQRGAAATNMQQLGEKQSKESYLRQQEATRDQIDLAKVNMTALNPSSTLRAGTTGRFQM